MDKSSISKLTTAQLVAISKTIAKHRPADLIESTVTSDAVRLRVTSRNTDSLLGEWILESRNGDMHLRVTVGDTLYLETLPEVMPMRFDRVLAGLEEWVKAMNAFDLKEVVANVPRVSHLSPEHIIDPTDYRPLGGVHAW